MRIGLITTLNTNIGDDFIRLGIQRLLSTLWPERKIDWICVNKHQPQTVWPLWHPMRHLPFCAPNYRRLAMKLPASRFADCDLIVQCGAPVIWRRCHRCEWHQPLWTEVIGSLCTRIPVLNIAAGSAFDMVNPPQHVELAEDREFLREILSYCRLTTSRDSLAQHLFRDVGGTPALLPCTAGLAHEPVDALPKGNRLYVNYMSRAGHFDFSKSINEEDWEKTFRTVLSRATDKYEVVFLCHNAEELVLASRLFPEYSRVLPESPAAYATLARRARLGLFNRLHAAVSFAGMGVPSVAVGNDTRLLMVREYGTPAFDVREANADALWKELTDLDVRHESEHNRLIALRTQIYQKYRTLLAKALEVAQ
jgi:hypothetical protein